MPPADWSANMTELTREQIKQAMRHPYSEWTPQFVEQLCDMALRACDAPALSAQQGRKRT